MAKAKDKLPAKRGQPTKYDPAFIPIVVKLVARGLQNYEIAETLNIDERTLYNWKREHEAFDQALTRSREQLNAQVEATLLMKAQGYERKVQKATASGKVVTVTEYFQPSDSAIQFWLRHQKTELYREQKDINVKHGVEDGFLRFLQRMDDKAKLEREAGHLPTLLEAHIVEEDLEPDLVDEQEPELIPEQELEEELVALEIALLGPELAADPGPEPQELEEAKPLQARDPATGEGSEEQSENIGPETPPPA